MSKYLFEVQEKNRLEQKGLLKRFSINCMGHQETVEEMRAAKTDKFAELKNNKKDPEYEEWFLRYRPLDAKEIKNNDKDSPIQTKRNGTNKTNKTRKTKKKKGFFF
jgi:hypothetical protein